MSFVLGISGSPRSGGNSDTLLSAVLKGCREEGLATETVCLREMLFSSCVGCERCRKDKICTRFLDGMTLLYPKIIAARGLVLVSPTHTYNVSALIKAFIDRLYCFYDFSDDRPRSFSSRLAGQERQAVICGVCEQTDPADMGATMDMLRLPLQALGYGITGELPVFGVFDAGKVKEQTETMARARDLGSDLARSLGVDKNR